MRAVWVSTAWPPAGRLGAYGDPPPGPFVALAAALHSACGIRRSGEITCWGYDGARTREGSFTHLSAGYGPSGPQSLFEQRFCALRADGEAECWGTRVADRYTPPPPWIPGAPYSDIAAGSQHACALRADGGGVLCWGDNRYGQTDAPEGAYIAITAGQWHTCALRADGDITCWGDGPLNGRYADAPEHISTDPPPGPFTAVTAGLWHTCALRPDGEATCWLSY